MNPNERRLVVVEKIEEESEDVKTFLFKDPLCERARAGQFVMVWVLGVDEVPMSLSVVGELCGITVKKVGDATAALHRLREGDVVGIRGPYGNGFTPIPRGKCAMVGGGTGVAPLLVLASQLPTEVEFTFIEGAKTARELILLRRLRDVVASKKGKLVLATEDGSEGEKGTAYDAFVKIAESEEFDIVYTCGPELMMKKVVDYCLGRGIPVQASLERYMKCGVGLCGHCVLDPEGLRVCVDGPVFDGETLTRISDFGSFKREASGKKVPL